MGTKMDIGGFIKDTKGRNKNEKWDLKKLGKGIVWLHPASGIFKRDAHYFPVYAEVMEDNKKVSKVYMSMIIHEDAKSCLICQLRKALRENDDIDNDEIILRVGEGSEEVEYNKGEIIGFEGYGWKKNIAYKTEYLFGMIDNAKPEKVLSLVAPKSLGKKITKVIEDQIEEEGEEAGNPFKNPYAFKLTYDEDAQASDMYGATWNKAAITEEVQELIDGEGVDHSFEVEITPESKVAYIIRASLIYDAEELGLDLSAADDFDPKELNRTGSITSESTDNKAEKKVEKKVEKKAEKKAEKKVEKKPVNGKKVLKTKTVKPAAKPQVECPSCGKMIDEDVNKCPHCEAEFVEATEITCPSCGETIAADVATCPECGADVNPF